MQRWFQFPVMSVRGRLRHLHEMMDDMTQITIPALSYNAILCRYSEIGLKGGNRLDFERRLMRNIQRLLAEIMPFKINREQGRIFLTPCERASFSAADLAVVRRRVPQIFGLVSASPAVLVPATLEALAAAVDATFSQVADAVLAAVDSAQVVRYATRCRRNNRRFPMTSNEIEIGIAEKYLPHYPRLKLDLKHAELRLQIEVRKQHLFVMYEDIAGPGGLPTGSGGRVLALLSGGIDSPVACAQAMRRGCVVDFITFHSSPYTPPASLRKVADLARILRQFQGEGQLTAVNLVAIQKEVRDRCEERYRTILYRRFMLRIASEVARRQGALGLVTGENLGQVASQTLENMTVIDRAADLPVLRPLLTFDKDDTVALATRLGTLRISQEPLPDSCTVFAPRQPATNARLDRILAEERKLDVPALVKEALATAVPVELD